MPIFSPFWMHMYLLGEKGHGFANLEVFISLAFLRVLILESK